MSVPPRARFNARTSSSSKRTVVEIIRAIHSPYGKRRLLGNERKVRAQRGLGRRLHRIGSSSLQAADEHGQSFAWDAAEEGAEQGRMTK
jgi:hypothetical protein